MKEGVVTGTRIVVSVDEVANSPCHGFLTDQPANASLFPLLRAYSSVVRAGVS